MIDFNKPDSGISHPCENRNDMTCFVIPAVAKRRNAIGAKAESSVIKIENLKRNNAARIDLM
jgi:hypothetical protein